MKLPTGLMMVIAYLCQTIGGLLGFKPKLTPFVVKMLTMHRWFKQDHAKKDLSYSPIISFKEGWLETIEWFRTEWLPKHDSASASSYGKIERGSQKKIDMQSKISKD